MIVLILAGGSGTRLWPLSTQECPKQFLTFGEPHSLLQRTVLRFVDIPFVHRIAIATSEPYLSLTRQQVEQLGVPCEIFAEPARKNTAPAIAYAIRCLDPAPDEQILILPSDHVIEPKALFHTYLDHVQSTAALGKIVTFGIRPTRPETGYGYIEIHGPFDAYTQSILRFVEKPDAKTAAAYLASGDYYWNSGMFLFTAKTFSHALQTHIPILYADETAAEMGARYHTLPDISIDYAIMEKSADIVVCPLALDWSDVGSWDSIYEIMQKSAAHNATHGPIETIDTTHCLLMGKKRIVAIGLDNLLFVESDEAILICKKGASQMIKKVNVKS